MKFDKQTIEFYDKNAQKYSSYSYEHEKGDLYQKFLNKLPKKCSILDVGCGAGWDTKIFLTNGYTKIRGYFYSSSQKIYMSPYYVYVSKFK